MRDLATEALDRVTKDLFIDDGWSVRDERTLVWTAYRLSQEFAVEGPFESRGMSVYRISSTVPVLTLPNLNAKEMEEHLSLFNQMSSGDTLVWHPQEGLIKSHLAAVFHAGTIDWRIPQFYNLAIVQLALLEARLETFARTFDAATPTWAHPVNGERGEPDEMLDVVAKVFVPLGKEPSQFAQAEEFLSIEEMVLESSFFSAGSSQEGLAIEVPFGSGDTSLVRLWADQLHPTLGSGLLVTIQARVQGVWSRHSPHRVAAYLNLLECEPTSSSHQFGSWHAKDDILAYARFVPNAMHAPGVSLDAAMGALSRAVWLAEVLDAPDDGQSPYDAAWISYNRLLEGLRPAGGAEA